jgi:hypothetical protein
MSDRPDNTDGPLERKRKEDALSAAFMHYLAGTGPFCEWKDDKETFKVSSIVSYVPAYMLITNITRLAPPTQSQFGTHSRTPTQKSLWHLQSAFSRLSLIRLDANDYSPTSKLSKQIDGAALDCQSWIKWQRFVPLLPCLTVSNSALLTGRLVRRSEMNTEHKV